MGPEARFLAGCPRALLVAGVLLACSTVLRPAGANRGAPAPPSRLSSPQAPRRLVVQHASYGVPGHPRRMRDVTAIVRTLLRRGERMFLVDKVTQLAGDPAPGVVKTLAVTYTLNGRTLVTKATDGEIFYFRGMTALRSATGYRDVASGQEKGVRIIVSSQDFGVGAMGAQQAARRLNQGIFVPNEPPSAGWMSNRFQHLPQWVWIHFPGPRRINKVLVYAATLASAPVDFSGQYSPDGGADMRTLFHVTGVKFNPRNYSCTVSFKPVVTTNFRLLITRVAASAPPWSNIVELAQVKVYGVNATGSGFGRDRRVGRWIGHQPAQRLDIPLHPTDFKPTVRYRGDTVTVGDRWYRLVLSRRRPKIMFLSWDALGQGELNVNFLHPSGAEPVLDPLFPHADRSRIPDRKSKTAAASAALIQRGNIFAYRRVQIAPGAWERVSIRADRRGFDLGLAAVADRKIAMRGGLFRFHFAANQTPTTFICRPPKLINYVQSPCYLDAPDFGTAYVTTAGDRCAFYRTPSSLFPASTYWVDITPQRPVAEDGIHELSPRRWHTVVRFAIQSPEPLPALVSRNPRLKRLPKYALNGVQFRPDTGILSNSVMSVDCGLSLLFYAQEALFVPHLKDGISPMGLVEESVERYFHGAPGYYMPDDNVCAPGWSSSRETAAYLVISGWYCIRTIGGMKLLQRWLQPLQCLANHIASHFHRDGLIYQHGPGMWFDCYNIHGADAYSNAADYWAFRCMNDLETLAGRPELARRYRSDARRIKAVYFKLFYDPRTGVLAGWRTKAGRLHDEMFPWANGFAICQKGLVTREAARAIMRRMLAQLHKIGFYSYQFGLPTNLIPMSPKDYIPNTSGAPRQANGMDTWQVYMNGGATPAFEYYFIQALYKVGLRADAERLLWPLVKSYGQGTFNAGIGLPGQRQRNPVGSAFYLWNGSRASGEGYLPEDWDGVEAIFTGYYGLGFDKNGYYLENWSPLKGQTVKLDLPYMGKMIAAIR